MEANKTVIFQRTDGANLQQYDSETGHRGNGDPNTEDASEGICWMKFAPRLVIGSEYPEECYKCFYPECPVNKTIERTTVGSISGILYRGVHNHIAPLPAEVLEALNDTLLEIEEGQDRAGGDPVSNPQDATESQVNTGDAHGAQGESSKSRKRKSSMSTPKAVVRTRSNVDILDDGYRWQKYGQKFVARNPNPRQYYKCTTNGCEVKKQIERDAHDRDVVVTTYEGRHNHEIPTPRRHYLAGYPINPPYQSIHYAQPQRSRFGFDQGGSSNQANRRMQPNQGQLPNLPVGNQFVGNQGQSNQRHSSDVDELVEQQGMMNVGGQMLPQDESNAEHSSNPDMNPK